MRVSFLSTQKFSAGNLMMIRQNLDHPGQEFLDARAAKTVDPRRQQRVLHEIRSADFGMEFRLDQVASQQRQILSKVL
jgi:hypothetical protein